MNKFWIITWSKTMHLVDGDTLTNTKQRFNDLHPKDRCDFIVSAIKCDCGKYMAPVLPDWMEFKYADTKLSLCHHEGKVPPLSKHL